MSKQDVLSRKLRLSLNPELINKNESGDDSLFKTGWINQKLTPKELADEINKGIAYSCELSGTRNANNFICSDILSVDIDDTRSIEDAMSDPFVERYLTIFYTTPNHTTERHRFRLVFALPRTIESPREMRAALRSLALRMNGDPSATDAARIFFGSRDSKPKVYDRGLTQVILDELIAQGLESNQTDGKVKRYVATVSKQPIAPDRMVQLASGQFLPFQDIPANTTIHCPFHWDNNASAFIVESKTGILGIHCSKCDQSFWPPNTRLRDEFEDFDNRVREAENYFSNNQDMGPFQRFITGDGVKYHPGLARSRIFRQENEFVQLPKPLPDGLVFVKSPKGTGKTEELRKALADEKGSVLLIGHRIALIRQSCARLDLECYLDFKGPLTKKNLGVCLDSLQKLSWTQRVAGKSITKTNLFGTIIIDESEQVLSHFLSDTIDAISRDKLFKMFTMLLREAKRVVALDADLGWLSFETLSKLAQHSSSKNSTLIVNEHKSKSSVQIYASKDHLIGDLKQSVADGQRAFVTSNSLNLATSLHNGLTAAPEAGIKSILITSETIAEDNVKAFIANPQRALEYDVILTSPSLGTGVDITFEGRQSFIDVVYGFFETQVNTHFDFDQQIWRVRHPGAVKIWISPRRFSFDTSFDVVKREIQQKGLYKSVLSHYDTDLTPQYHTDDPLIDMAVLARSQQLASKNNLKRNFITMKQRHGHSVEFVESDKNLSVEGSNLKEEGKLAGGQKWRALLMAAKTLKKDEFDEIEDQIKSNQDVGTVERFAFARTRIERFYRQSLSEELIDLDNKGRLRGQIIKFEHLRVYSENEKRNRNGDIPQRTGEYSFKLKFLRDERAISGLMFELLSEAGIYSDGVFDLGTVVSLLTLRPLMRRATALKPTIENLLDLEVRKGEDDGVTQLRSVLKVIGLDQINVGNTKINDRKIYLYQLSADKLNFIEEIVQRRDQVGGWEFLNSQYGWSASEDDELFYGSD